MKYQLEITTLLVPVNVHQLFEKCEWPELNSFDKEMVEDYFSDLVNGIQTDEALDDWKLTIVYRYLFGSQSYQYPETWNHRYGNKRKSVDDRYTSPLQ